MPPALEYPLDKFEVVDSHYEDEGTEDAVQEKAPHFERFANGGAFQLTKDIQEKDVPPGRIVDLKVLHTQWGENNTLSALLSWTCPGAHLDFGNGRKPSISAET